MDFEKNYPKLKKFYTEDGGLKNRNDKGELENGVFYGEAASEEELQEISGLTNEMEFVPKDPMEKEKYYKQKTFNVLNRYALTRPEALELFRYYNGKLVDIYTENPDLNKEEDGGMEKSEKDQLREFFQRNLLSMVQNEEFYSLPAGKILQTNKQFEKEFFGYSFSIKLQSTREDSLDNTFILKNNITAEEYQGRFVINTQDEKVVINLIPLPTIENKEPKINAQKINEEKLKVMIGFYYWLRFPQQTNRVWTGQRRPGGPEKKGDFALIDVGKEVKESTLPFRRRMVGNVQDAWVKTEELLGSLGQEYINTAINNNEGELAVNIHCLTYSNEQRGGRWSDTFDAHLDERGTGFVGNCVADRAQVESLVSDALILGSKAVISIRGCWRVPELEGSPKGKSPRGNVKRLRQKNTGSIEEKLFLPKYDKDGKLYDQKLRVRAHDLYEKNKEGNLSEDEKKELGDLLINLNAKEVAENLFSIQTNEGVYFANGSFMQGDTWKNGGGANYVIRPKKMEAA